jgi:hypothetical protein
LSYQKRNSPKKDRISYNYCNFIQYFPPLIISLVKILISIVLKTSNPIQLNSAILWTCRRDIRTIFLRWRLKNQEGLQNTNKNSYLKVLINLNLSLKKTVTKVDRKDKEGIKDPFNYALPTTRKILTTNLKGYESFRIPFTITI